MFQTTMGAALEARIATAVASLTIAAVMICGALCILCAAILLLHQWFQSWEAFGIGGLATLVYLDRKSRNHEALNRTQERPNMNETRAWHRTPTSTGAASGRHN